MDSIQESEGGSNKSPNLFLPLTGNENFTRLQVKFEQYFDEIDEESEVARGNLSKWKLSDTQWLNSQYTRTPSTAGKGKLRSPWKPANSRQQLDPNHQGERIPSNERFDGGETTTSNKCWNGGETSEDSTYWASGFSSLDTERPKLTIPPQGPKVDFVLSADDVQPPVVVPGTINQYLRDYQREGIKFLYQHYCKNLGAILGDDMGLGKTIQVIGFLSALLGKKGNYSDSYYTLPKFIREFSDDFPEATTRRCCKPFLIIGPSATLYNWLTELNVWGYFTAKKFHGPDKETCLADLAKGKLEIIVTTFETFRENLHRLNQVQWEAVIVDEVHKIKTLKAQVTQALRTLNTPCRFGLTGTALQNNFLELWSILDWAQPGVLGSQEMFEMQYVTVIETGQRHDATKRELAQARKQKDKFAEVRKKMLLRRTKALIADQLPHKEELVVMCKLTEFQVSVYKAILSHPDMALVLQAEDPCDCNSQKSRASCCYKYSSDGRKAWTLVFSFMHVMLKAANHTALLIPDERMKEKQAQLVRSVCDVAFKDHPHFVQQTQVAAFRTLSDPKYCGKMKILAGLLSVFAANHDKVLVFSYSTKLLDIIEQYVIGQGHSYCRIDGKVSSQRRQDIVTQFNTDSSLFLCLVSTRAGGLGLNLTGANKVVIFDPNWNPSHDLQAQDRAYRIGQTRDVQVFRLVSAGTIEENIYLRQIYKQQLDEVAIGTGNARRYFHGIQGDRGHQGELFGVKNLFALRTGDSCLTMDILQRNEKLEKSLAGYDVTKYVPPRQPTDEDVVSDTDRDGVVTEPCSHTRVSDSDSDEETTFWTNIFGSAVSTATIQQQHVNHPTDPSSSSDEEFSHIPNLHKSKKNLNLPSTSHLGLSRDVPGSVVSGSPVSVVSASPVSYPLCHLEKKQLSICQKNSPVKLLNEKKRKLPLPLKSKRLQKTGQKQKFTSVASVLGSRGVLHTHAHHQVIGSSRAEDHMTRCAMEDVFEHHINSQEPALQCQPYAQPEEKATKSRKMCKKELDYNTKRCLTAGPVNILLAQTPVGIQRCQWTELCMSYGMDSVTFAKFFVSSHLEKRLAILRDYYTQQHPQLEAQITGIFQLPVTCIGTADERVELLDGSTALKTDGSMALMTAGSMALKTDGSTALKTDGSIVLKTDGSTSLKTAGSTALKTAATAGSTAVKINMDPVHRRHRHGLDMLDSTPSHSRHRHGLDMLDSTPSHSRHRPGLDMLDSTPSHSRHRPGLDMLDSTPTLSRHRPGLDKKNIPMPDGQEKRNYKCILDEIFQSTNGDQTKKLKLDQTSMTESHPASCIKMTDKQELLDEPEVLGPLFQTSRLQGKQTSCLVTSHPAQSDPEIAACQPKLQQYDFDDLDAVDFNCHQQHVSQSLFSEAQTF